MKKKFIVAATAGALTLAAGSAFAFENEFHGMYKFMGYESNVYTGVTGPILEKDARSGWYAEQRARLQYIAKANDNLKLVTQFELDARFGGKSTSTTASATNPGGDAGYLGTKSGNDAGNLDADQLTLETKNIYLDFNCPITGTNMKVGMQPWADAYNSLFLLADMTGVYATKKFSDPFTASLGWFRYDDNSTNTTAAYNSGSHRVLSGDLFVLDTKFAINKDMKVGFTFYDVENDNGVTLPTTTAAISEPHYETLRMVGLNADLTFGPANVKPFAAYQFGKMIDNGDDNMDINAWMAGTTAKIKAGPGAVNFAAFYLSGVSESEMEKENGDLTAFQPLTTGTTYFGPANMWLLVRNGQAINSSFSVLGNDLTVGAHGMWGVFAGYEGTADKLFYNANIGYGQAAKAWGDEKKDLGTEINCQVGYKLFDNLTASAALAYMMLGKGLNGDDNERLNNAYGKQDAAPMGKKDAEDPWLLNVQLSYTF